MPPEELTGSASAKVYGLLANSSLHPLALEDWLGVLTRAFGARIAALAALSKREPLAQYCYSRETELLGSVNWPWHGDVGTVGAPAKGGPAVPTRSADGRSSFLTVSIESNGLLWVLALEDAAHRSWTVEEQAALTLAALGLFQFPSVQPRAWANWSEIVRIQQRLEDAAVVVGRLAHDFNNVLTSVLGFTELSLTHLSPGGSQRKLMSEVFAAAQQGSHLTSQLSLFSTRRTVSQDSTTFLNFLLGTTAKQWRESWGDAITLEVRTPADLSAVSIDAESLRIILDKLADNARAAIASTGTITVSARPVNLSAEDCLGLLGKARPGPYVELTVADSGCGFSPEARRRVFAEPFFSTKPRHRGLGLPTVYGVLVNFGGAIHLEHGLQNGAQVHVYLPTAGSAEPSAAAATEKGQSSFAECGRKRVYGRGLS